jgi:5-formyltetrahydrofolate cyclo-ligase
LNNSTTPSPESVQKAALRRALEARRNALSPEARAALSAALCARAAGLPAFAAAKTIHCYLPMRSEADPRALIEAAFALGKRVAVPIFLRKSEETPCALIRSLDPSEFEPGVFGLSHPRARERLDPAEIDVVFVPLLGFARMGGAWHRIGYGAGYYDTFLSRLASRTLKIGFAFAEQRLDEFPIEAHDIALDDVVTPGG